MEPTNRSRLPFEIREIRKNRSSRVVPLRFRKPVVRVPQRTVETIASARLFFENRNYRGAQKLIEEIHKHRLGKLQAAAVAGELFALGEEKILLLGGVETKAEKKAFATALMEIYGAASVFFERAGNKKKSELAVDKMVSLSEKFFLNQ